jgi:hypothetical protein
MLDSARAESTGSCPSAVAAGRGIAATPAANVAHGLGDGLAGATVAASPSVALVGSYELLMMIIRAAADLLSNQRSARETQGLRHDSAFPRQLGMHSLAS